MDKPTVTTELSRDLNLFHLTMMGLGMMIGAGVFLGIGNAIRIAGPGGVLLTFALNTLLALFTAMSYAELSSAIPRAGGAYNFARIGFGRGTSFLAGWMEWFASSVAGSMYAITFAIYTVRYLEQLGALSWLALPTLLVKPVAVLIALFFLYINYRGASETGKTGAIMTAGQTLFLIVIGVVGVAVAIRDPSRLQNFRPFLPFGWSRLFITMGFTYVAFEGFEVIAQAGDEAVEPKKNLPKAMLFSVYIVGLTYVAVAFATVVAVKAGSSGVSGEPWQWIGSFRERGFGEAVARLIPFGNFLLTLAVIFASTSALNATVYSATRASYALGRDRMLPRLFARISKRRKTPWFALLATGFIVLLVATVLPTMDVASSASLMFLFLFFLVNLCVIKIRLNMSDELQYGYLTPLFPIVPLLAISVQVVLAAELRHMSLIALIVAPVWILAGILIYYFYSRSRALPAESEIHVIEEEAAPEGDEYRIMVPVANPENALSLVWNTHKIGRSRPSRIKLLHMVPVPDQVALSDAETYMTEGREGIVEAMLYLVQRFPVTTTFRYCRNIARGITSAVRERKIDLLIMGWHGKSGDRRFRIGSTLDPVISRAPCDIVILKDCGNKSFSNILVPLFGDANDVFALDSAERMIQEQNGEITAMQVRGAARRQRGIWSEERYLERLLRRLEYQPVKVRLKASPRMDPVRAVLRESKHYDLVVLGLSGSFLRQVGVPTVAEQIARHCPTPLVLAKASVGLSALAKKWI
ncbi:MAG: amino acid permease [Spirochaetaceae bacterium]|nr:MAG: amino acid permease [Spirochaetaceae bacterium]